MTDTTINNRAQQEKRIFKPNLATPLFSSTGSSEDTEFVKSIMDAYANKFRKLSGRSPIVNFHDSGNHIRKALNSRPHGKKIMDEAADILKFMEKLLPDEPIHKFLNRYLDTNILPPRNGSPGKPKDGPGQAEDKPSPDAPVQKRLVFRDVAEEYFSKGGLSANAEYSNYRSFLKPFMDLDPAAITLRDMHGLLDDMYVGGRSMAEVEATLNLFNGIMTRTGNGKYAHLLDREISTINMKELLTLPDDEKTPPPAPVQETEGSSRVDAAADKLPLIDRVALCEKNRKEKEGTNRAFALEAGVSETTYADVKRVLERGADSIIGMVRSGSLPAYIARKVVDRFTGEEQEKLTGKGAKAIKAMFKRRAGNNPATPAAPPDAYREVLAAVKALTDAVARLDRRMDERATDTVPVSPAPPDPDRYLSARDFYKHVRERRERRIG